MTKRVEASPKADTATDYDNLLRANAKRVFSEPDVQQRLTALKELWAEKGVLLENEHVVTGWEVLLPEPGRGQSEVHVNAKEICDVTVIEAVRQICGGYWRQ